MPLVIIKSDPRAREKPCIRCGYSLRKVTDANHCPECGLSVWLSLNQNDTLEMSNPEWLRRIAIALLVMAAANLVMLAALVPLTGHLVTLMQYRQAQHEAWRAYDRYPDDPSKWKQLFRPYPHPDYARLRIAMLIGAAGFAAYHAGLVILASNEGRYPDKLAASRLGARVVAAVALVPLFLIGLQSLKEAPDFPAWFTRLVAAFSAAITWGILFELARRMPSKRLRRLSGWMTLIPFVSVLYSFIRNSDWPPDVIPLLYFPTAAALFVAFAVHLRRNANTADKNWSAETAMTR
jgi:hypothetical protein